MGGQDFKDVFDAANMAKQLLLWDDRSSAADSLQKALVAAQGALRLAQAAVTTSPAYQEERDLLQLVGYWAFSWLVCLCQMRLACANAHTAVWRTGGVCAGISQPSEPQLTITST